MYRISVTSWINYHHVDSSKYDAVRSIVFGNRYEDDVDPTKLRRE